MADRRGDESLPRRPLSGPQPAPPPTERRQLSERVTAAISAANASVQAAAASRQAGSSAAPTSQPGAPTTPVVPGTGKGAKDATAARAGSSPTKPKGTRRARLRLVHLDPWSVMKTAFLLSIAFGIVTVVAVAVVWSVLGAAGVWDSINSTVRDVLGGDSSQTFDVTDYVGTSRVLGFTMVFAVADVLLITAMATLSAFLYNLAAALLGGVEVTLAEDDR